MIHNNSRISPYIILQNLFQTVHFSGHQHHLTSRHRCDSVPQMLIQNRQYNDMALGWETGQMIDQILHGAVYGRLSTIPMRTFLLYRMSLPEWCQLLTSIIFVAGNTVIPICCDADHKSRPRVQLIISFYYRQTNII